MKGGICVKMKSVLKESFRLYKQNFSSLCLALLVELVLRAIALSPGLFLADKALAPLACIAIPLYLLIVLPARQNYALALQDMMNGGSVFSLRLIATENYSRKLLRGLKGTLCMLLWSSVTIAGVVLLYLSFKNLMDGFTLMGVFYAIGGSVADGVWLVLGALVASTALILLGCAIHSGGRHAAALGDRKLLRGNRLRLMALWFLGLMMLIPSVALAAAAVGNVATALLGAPLSIQQPFAGISLSRLGALAGGAVALIFPVLPLKNMLPAVYLRMVKEKNDAAA